MTTRIPKLPGIYDPGSVLNPSPQATGTAPSKAVSLEGGKFDFLQVQIQGALFEAQSEKILITTPKPRTCVDVYLAGGGNAAGGAAAEYTLYANVAGIRTAIARNRLFGREYGRISNGQQNPAGPIYLFGGRVAAQSFEVAYTNPNAVSPTNVPSDLLVTALAYDDGAQLPEAIGLFYPFRGAGLQQFLKSGTTVSSQTMPVGVQLKKATGVNLTSTRFFFRVREATSGSPAIWQVNIPADGGFDFELPADVEAQGLFTENGLILEIVTTAGVLAANGSVFWNALLK